MAELGETAFIEQLMDHIMEGVMIPKVQVERAVGPIIGMFIDQVLSETFGEELVTLCPEFPIRKCGIDGSGHNQSTNIDWLMFSRTNNYLLFLELKTTDTTFDQKQLEIYLALKEMIKHPNGAAFLIDDIERICEASLEHGKYQNVLDRIDHVLPDSKVQFGNCKAARIVYLAPAVSKPKEWPENDSSQCWLRFKDLASDIKSPFDAQWKIIRKRLIELDDVRRCSRNDQPEVAERNNYQGRDAYQEILDRCKREGNSIIVGFNGGSNALKTSDLAYLQARSYKWDSAKQAKGCKEHKNWIPGYEFLLQIEKLSNES